MNSDTLNYILLIEQDLWDSRKTKDSVSVLAGTGSFSLFYYMLYKLTNDEEYENKFYETIDDLFERLNEENYVNTYCNGLTGVAYLLNFYKVRNIIDPADIDDSLVFFDGLILNWVKKLLALRSTDIENSNRHLDFLHGAFGGLFYLNERTKENPLIKEEVNNLFIEVCSYIDADIEAFNSTSNILFNTGLAHGTVSYILILSKFLKQNENNTKVKETLKLCADTLMGLKSDDKENFSLFPGKVEDKSHITYTVPLGWCYGDQSVLFGLNTAAKVLKDEAMEKLSNELALTTISDRMINESIKLRNNDTGLCHGFAGIGYMCKRWYQLTDNNDFKETYNGLLKKLLEQANYADCTSGFKRYIGEGKFESSFSLLDGSAGIGIFLMDDLLKENTVDWDELFLLR